MNFALLYFNKSVIFVQQFCHLNIKSKFNNSK